jgi:5'-nucleotidase (lipoprotein e(P4) family)
MPEPRRRAASALLALALFLPAGCRTAATPPPNAQAATPETPPPNAKAPTPETPPPNAKAATPEATPEATPAPTPAATPAPPAATRSSAAIRWVRESAEHRAIFLEIYAAAAAYLDREASQRERGSWAVVLDADETVLDNSTFELEREAAGLPFNSPTWHAWTKRREAKPLPGAKAFLDHVRELGGRIAIVTNRTVSECPDTEAVFRAHELAFDVMLCKPDVGPSDKNPRFEAVAHGTTPAGLPPLEVVAFLGDNINDFPGQSQAIRTQPDAAFATFGARFFVLPNPMYGSWERH